MARKRRQEEHENHERWLVSYADFITLLFAFFVVMYAVSSVNEGKYKVLSDSLTNDGKKLEQRQKMKNVAGDIMEALQPLVAQGKVRLLETSRGVTIEINDSILFPAGQARLQSASINAMRAIASVLAESDFPITIEGHTDNVPISTPQFPSNWELSAMRATTVLRLFNDD